MRTARDAGSEIPPGDPSCCRGGSRGLVGVRSGLRSGMQLFPWTHDQKAARSPEGAASLKSRPCAVVPFGIGQNTANLTRSSSRPVFARPNKAKTGPLRGFQFAQNDNVTPFINIKFHGGPSATALARNNRLTRQLEFRKQLERIEL